MCWGRGAGGRYDVIFMDILMPVMGGLEATAKLRSDPPKDAPRPIIVSVTASDSAAQGRAATVAGVDDQVRFMHGDRHVV